VANIESGPTTVTIQQVVPAAAGHLDPDRPILAQLATARPVDHHTRAGALTPRPGQARRIIHRMLCWLLMLTILGRTLS
jgi:hypothetical protein